MAAAAIWLWSAGERTILTRLVGLTEDQALVRKVRALAGVFQWPILLSYAVTALACVAALTSFVRRQVALWILRTAAAAHTLLAVLLLVVAWHFTASISEMDPDSFPSAVRNELWVRETVLLLPGVMLGLVLLFLLNLRSAVNFYTAENAREPALGDRIWMNLRSHGKDPAMRKAVYTSAAAHFFVLFVLPFIMGWGGCQKPYGVPKGTGSPVLEVVKIKRIKKKIEKKFALNMNTPILFYVPRLDESEIFEEVDKLTENQYQAQQVGQGLGAGGGGKGGWPNGMEKALVRFIRLEYDGGDWDQDMGFGADYNMLLRFRELTGFNIASKTESIRIADLMRFPKKRAPPFVYLTGGLNGSIGVSQSEIRVLRKYCLEMGGMIFADNGGGNFDQSFRSLMRRVFPDLPLVEISHDDVIFRQPYAFPNGAPPLWHHSGTQALGIKHAGRWVVFYHQGDINDAWKDGHSGVSDALAAQAYKMGVNVMNYAFNQYMKINYGDQ